MRIQHFVALALCAFQGSLALAAIPANYYDGVDTSSAVALRADVNAIITAGHSQVGYGNTWAPLLDMQEDPGDSSAVILIYSGDSRAKSLQCSSGGCNDGDAFTGDFNREHIWPQGSFDEDEPARSDLHALFLADADANGWRSNSSFDEVTGIPTYSFGGTIGTTSLWEPRDAIKGQIARAMLYMDVRYEGPSPIDLVLSDAPNTANDQGEQGILSTLLDWHINFPPTADEIARNNAVYDYQGNANPFIDNPGWVNIIWGIDPVSDGDTLVVSPADEAPSTATVGDEIAMLSLTLTASANEWDIATIQVLELGTIADSEIQAVRLYIDVNGDGQLDGGDTLSASATFSGGAATIDANDLRVDDGGRDLLLAIDTDATADENDTVRLALAASGISHSPTGGNDTNPTFSQFASGTTTLDAAPSGAGFGIVISEIMYNPDSNEGGANGREWVEIFNTDNATNTLANWILRDEDATSDPFTVTLNPFEAAVLIDADQVNTAGFQAAWGTGYKIVEVNSFPALANTPAPGNEVLELFDGTSVVDVVDYDDANPWPSDSPDGPSIYLLDGFFTPTDNDNGANWARSQVGTHGAFANTVTGFFDGSDVGSPGTVFAPSVPVELDLFLVE